MVELLDPVVRQEDPLEPGTVLETVHRFDQVPPQIQLGQRDQAVQVLNSRYQVVSKVQHSQLRQVIDVFNFCDLIRVEVEYVQLIQVLQVPNSLYVILTQHEYSQSWDRVQVCYLFDLVIIEVKENKVGK